MPRHDVITFDCYGTLIDWEAGIAQAFAQAGIDVPAARIIAAYAALEPVVQAETFHSYTDVLATTAKRVLIRLGVPGRDTSFLADSLPSWKPFPDTVPALRRLADAGVQLGLLSNIDDELLARTREHFAGVPFAFTVTASQVKSYKPATGHWFAAQPKVSGARWLHAAQSYFHDIQPARTLGLETAWVNRKAEASPDGDKPTVEVPDLAGLAAWELESAG
jgi:2-haloalkanoic acid dehalogenase type II